MKKEFSTNDHIHPDNGKNPHNQDSPQNGTWNDHQLEQLFGEALGIFPPQTKPESLADIHPSSPYQTPIYPTNNDTGYSRRCHRLGTCIPAFTAT